MQKTTGNIVGQFLGGLNCYLRRCMFAILSVGPVPSHIAFIMDGNRRYAKKKNMEEGDGHKAGFNVLTSLLRYCYELGVRYVTVYAFSIDNFKRKSTEVQSLMELMQKKIEELLEQESLINEYGVRLHFIGDMQLLTEPVRAAVEKATRVTAHNNQRVLLICVAYTSRHEIVHAVQECCKETLNEVQTRKKVKVTNGAFSRIDQVLKGNDFDLLSQESCKEYPNATKACSAEVETAARKEGLFENNIENHIGNYTEAETRSCNGLVELTEERKDIQDERGLLICVAYTSRHEIVHAVQECCKETLNEVQTRKKVKVTNGAFSRIDQVLKGNDFDLLSQESSYTSRHEIVHAVQECCKEKLNEVQTRKKVKVTNGAFSRIDQVLKGNDFDLLSQDSCKEYPNATKACSAEVETAARKEGLFENNIENHIGNYTEAETRSCNGLVELTEERKDIQDEVPFIKLADIEKNMYMAVAPDPDILIRSSGEARLSNFLLWQTSTCPLYAPTALWPEIGLRHLIWAVLNFQRHYFYLEKKKKQS
ncbi:ditrans [Vigna unguiculata]|uniref:Ditrans n=1 Tax=Vigna unguiculata TaxID=3917 RepID=A0A4D6KX77_VIGUN|nr:ditrans [Vigna unguiculata]